MGVVVLSGDDVLLVERAKPPKAQEWSLPGGAQNVGETLHMAAIREVREETGLDVAISGLVDVIDFIERDDAGDARYHYTLVDYWAEASGRTLIAGDDARQATWVARSSIDDLPLWTQTQRVIHMAFNLRDAARR